MIAWRDGQAEMVTRAPLILPNTSLVRIDQSLLRITLHHCVAHRLRMSYRDPRLRNGSWNEG